MYPTRGANAYGQQSYGAQQAYGQVAGSAYPGGSLGGPEGGLQLSIGSRHSSMLSSSQDSELGGYRTHPSAAAHYGGEYGSVYGGSSLGSGQQIGAVSGKGAGSSTLQGRTGYASALAESPKFASGALGSSLGLQNDDYVSSSNHGYGHKGDQYSSGKISDYAAVDRRNYGEHQSAYIGRDLQSESARRYADSVGLSHQHQSEMHDPIEQASLLRQQQMLKAQAGTDMRHTLAASAALDSSARQADYLAARGATIRHGTQDISSYGGRMDADPRNLSVLGNASYAGQRPASILGAVPRRNVDDLIYNQGSSSASYGVGLPPGRDYIAGKGYRGASIESDYPGSVLSRGGHSSIVPVDERKDDRIGFRRELEIREHDHRREHAREREKEREREKDRERERERERERARESERRDKERERLRKRGLEVRRELPAPRTTRDRHGSSVIRNERSLQRDSPRQEASHRHHSPIKEKRREYVCKVYPSCLVEVERDYLSINKRYPRLSISPEFSKVVLHWPKGNLSLSIHTPVSFEHDFVEVDSKSEEPSKELVVEEPEKPKSWSTIWNAKVVLMSGINSNALEELCSDKSSDERISHFNNILRFAILRKDRSFMAIGGPWDIAMDGGDPMIDDSSLIRTALRHAKDLTRLDLHKCQHWNRFLEIHYDRVGKDGLFSHKEITVLFVPDLSECIPSLDSWRSQWYAYKKAKDERERQLSFKREKKSSERKEGDRSQNKSENIDSIKTGEIEGKMVKDEKEEKKISDAVLHEQGTHDGKMDKMRDNNTEVEQNTEEKKEKRPAVDETQTVIEGGSEVGREGNNEKNGSDELPVAQESEVQKLVKKKIIKKVTRVKVANKKSSTDNAASKENEKLDEVGGEKEGTPETIAQLDGETADPAGVKTFVRKRPVKTVPKGKATQNEDKVAGSDEMQTEKIAEKEVQHQEDATKDQKEGGEASVVQEPGTKTTLKRKVIRKVVKKKANEAANKDLGADSKKDEEKDESMIVQEVSEVETSKEQSRDADEQPADIKKSAKNTTPKKEPKITADKKDDDVSATENDIKDGGEDKKEEAWVDAKDSKIEKRDAHSKTEATKHEESKKGSNDGQRQKAKDDKEKKPSDGKEEPKRKSSKELKDKVKPEEPPQQHGLILQTKCTKESKLRSMSLSLDALLDYNDKDIEESTFELSLFAESIYEMLQYQMGCSLLAFLEKLRLRFVKKRNQQKRQRDENLEMESGKQKSSQKRSKLTDEPPVEGKSSKQETVDATGPDNDVTMAKEGDRATGLDEPKMETATDYDDDDEPEEVFPEDQEIGDPMPSDDALRETGDENKVAALENEHDKETPHGKDEAKESADVKKSDDGTAKTNDKLENESTDKGVETDKKADAAAKEAIIDKELLQAFRFFDRNRVGYIKVEDLRLIIHNLGKFLSHRDVKELVQSALLESNTARDNRILYHKLVRLSDI